MSARATSLPGPALAAALFVALGLLFGWAGAFDPTELPAYAESARQITGMALMLMFLTPYLVLAVWVGRRRSLALVEQARPLLTDPSVADAAVEDVRTALRRTWPPAVAAGLVMGILNTDPTTHLRGNVPVVAMAISCGQLVLWLTIGLLLGIRFGTARGFRRLAEVVPLDLLRPDRLKPIARSGVVDVVIIMGALLFAPLQSLDAEFRWFNYHFGLLVALPSTAFFLAWPLVPLQRRNREERDARLAAVEEQLGTLAGRAPADADAAIRLEALLAHRDRLRAVRTWPLSTGLLSRVVLYLVIPPLAWAGAAVVERVVDRLLGS